MEKNLSEEKFNSKLKKKIFATNLVRYYSTSTQAIYQYLKNIDCNGLYG